MNILAALLIFTVIVVVHELGHFSMAKFSGVGVTEFSVGMGPRLITLAKVNKKIVCKFLCSQKKFEEDKEWEDVTKYSVKLLPLGGSCAMVGEDEADDSENSFNQKGLLPRFLIVFFGPFFNIILAFVLSLVIIGLNGIDIPEVMMAPEGQPAYEAGIKEGDIIESIDGKSINLAREINTYVMLHPLGDDDIKITVLRDGKKKSFYVNPHYETHIFGFDYKNSNANACKIESIAKGSGCEKAGLKAGDIIKSVNGVKVANGEELSSLMAKVSTKPDDASFVIERDGKEHTFDVTPTLKKTNTLGLIAAGDKACKNAFQAIKYGVLEVKYWVYTAVSSLYLLITGHFSLNDVSGPVGIVSEVGSVIDRSKAISLRTTVISIIYMALMLSANLGVMNLIPFPALDGGRLVFILFEAVRRKPFDRDKEGYVNFIGFAVLMLFMVVVMFNDIAKLIR